MNSAKKFTDVQRHPLTRASGCAILSVWYGLVGEYGVAGIIPRLLITDKFSYVTVGSDITIRGILVHNKHLPSVGEFPPRIVSTGGFFYV